MTVRFCVGAFLLVTPACASLSRARAAEAMQCPEVELTEGEVDNPEGAKILGALVLLPLARTVPNGPTVRRWSGCGMTYACDSDTCDETQQSRAGRLTAAVPALMERSRQRILGATAERSGYFSWDLSSPRGPSQCHLTSLETYSCSPDLEAAPAAAAPRPASTPTPPPAPPPTDPPREPLRRSD